MKSPILALIVILNGCSVLAREAYTPGFDFYYEMLMQSQGLSQGPIVPDPRSPERVVTFGGEKEGSTSVLTRVASPDRELLQEFFALPN